nr:DnaJ domain, zinc finger, CCHC-type, tetratricopeptide-like helical domain protein [Tanacetum cinerariifolium]
MARVAHSSNPDYTNKTDYDQHFPPVTSHNHHDNKKQPHYSSSPVVVTHGVSGGTGNGRFRATYGRCFLCDELGHYARECPVYGPRTTPLRNYASYYRCADAVESSSGTQNVRPKPINVLTDISSNFEPVSPLLGKVKHKKKELQSRDEEIESLKCQLNKATTDLSSAQAKNEEITLNMNKATTDLKCTKSKNEELTVNMKNFQEELQKCKWELSSLRDKDEEMTKKWWDLNNEFVKIKDVMNEKIKHLEEVNKTRDDEILKQKLETKQWKKTTKDLVSILAGGAELSSKTPELESLLLHYTNRAVKRMSIGKTRKALDDCRMATYLDPGFLQVCLIAGNCHLVRGELDEALCCYKKCLDSGMVCLDRRLTIEASDGLQSVEKVGNHIKQSAELLQLKTFESATNAMEIVTEALSVSCYSEKLLELEGEALFQLHKYEEVVQMCEQTLAFAEKNCGNINDSKRKGHEDQNRELHLWRWSLISRSYYHMGKFDLALTMLQKYEQLAPSETKTEEPSLFSATTVHELLQIKSAGNDAFQSGKFIEAVEHYTNAIMRSIESRPFAAICLCNRAAAHQSLGNVIDAIADCNLAIALDGDYMKAISRRASLHEKIRDYEHAFLDLKRLISLLEKRSEKKYVEDLKVSRQHLSSLKRYMNKGMSMDLYMILGLKGSESGSEIKKAYHKAALRHHPDKAGKFLARSESGADGDIWKDIMTTIHMDADKLFKKIGEAYAVLSDANKRHAYNLEDVMKDGFVW